MIRPLLRRAFLRHLRRHPLQLATTLAGGRPGRRGDGRRGARQHQRGKGVPAFGERASRAAPATRSWAALRGSTKASTWRLRRSARALRAALGAGGRRLGPHRGRRRPAAQAAPFGVDPFADLAVRDFSRRSRTAAEPASPAAGTLLLAEAGAVALPAELAAELGKNPGDTILEFEAAGQMASLRLRQLIPAGRGAGALDLVLADIATAQEVLGRLGRLDRVDLRLAGAAEEAAATALLPPGASLREQGEPGRRARPDDRRLPPQPHRDGPPGPPGRPLPDLQHDELRGGRRRALLGRLRILGVERRQIFLAILLESAVIGALGTALGLLLGVGLAQGLLELVTRTINDLYFVLEVRGVALDPLVLLRGAALGPRRLAAGRACRRPARRWARRRGRRRCARTSSGGRAVAQEGRSPLEPGAGAARRGLPGLARQAAWRWPSPAFSPRCSPTPAGCRPPPACWRWPPLPCSASLPGSRAGWRPAGWPLRCSRTGVAAAALVVAIATTVGVDVMVRSFRGTLLNWLEVTLQADLYLAANSAAARGLGLASGRCRRAAGQSWPRCRGSPRCRPIGGSRSASPQGPVAAAGGGDGARSLPHLPLRRAAPPPRSGRPSRAGEGVIVSEPFAFRRGLGRGDRPRAAHRPAAAGACRSSASTTTTPATAGWC